MLRECVRHESLANFILTDKRFYDFFAYVELSTFDIASDAFASFKVGSMPRVMPAETFSYEIRPMPCSALLGVEASSTRLSPLRLWVGSSLPRDTDFHALIAAKRITELF